MVFRIGFVVNPIAGMGGRVGLKGTDGVLDKAIKLGAEPVSPLRAADLLIEFFSRYKSDDVKWVTCSGDMGENCFKKAGFKDYTVVYHPSEVTAANDTKNACKRFLEENVDLIVFCGGDGTARDVFSVVDKKIPILGVPCGVKMHSGVFAVNVSAAARMIHEFVKGSPSIGDVEILDLDEERYRSGEWNIKLFGVAKGVVEPTYVQVGKSVFESVSDDVVRDELAEHIDDEMQDDSNFLYLMGSGGTIDYIADKIGLENTLLGLDAVYKKKTIASDLNEKKILKLLKKYQKVKLVLSPIGAQGFILGRGNLQLSPSVIRKIGLDNIIVISTPAKLLSTPVLRIDTGDKNLDLDFQKKEFMMVVIGYRLSRVVKIQTNKF